MGRTLELSWVTCCGLALSGALPVTHSLWAEQTTAQRFFLCGVSSAFCLELCVPLCPVLHPVPLILESADCLPSWSMSDRGLDVTFVGTQDRTGPDLPP